MLRQKRLDEQNDLLQTYQISGLKRREDEAAQAPIHQAELERLLVAARGGDADAIAKVIARRPDLADEFRAPKPTNPLIGSPEWEKAERFKASLKKSASSDVENRLDQRQALSQAQAAKRAYDQMLARRPEARKPVLIEDPKKGWMEEPRATAEKRAAFSADSTFKAQDVKDTFAAAKAAGAPVHIPAGILRPVTKAERYEELRDQGKTHAQAVATVNSEYKGR